MFVKRFLSLLFIASLILVIAGCSIISNSNKISPVWTNTVGDGVAWINMNYDGAYIAVAADSAYLFGNDGNRIWAKDVNPEVIAIDSSGDLIATGSDADVYLFKVNGELLWHIIGDPGDEDIEAVSMSDDGNYIAFGTYNPDNNGKVYLYKKDGSRVIYYTTLTAYADGVSLSGDGSYLAAGSGGTALFFDNSGDLLWQEEVDTTTLDTITAAGISYNGNSVAFGSTDKCVYYFNNQGDLKWKFQTEGTINQIKISRDGEYIAVGSVYDDNIYFLKSDGTLLWKVDVDNWIRSIDMDYGCNFITVGTDADDMFLINKNGTVLWKYTGIGSWGGTPISGDGKYIASATNYDVSLFKND